MSAREDWPFGPELRRRREAQGLSVREAARRTNKRVSEGRWRQLEEGVSRTHGQEFPINTKASTAAAAAKVVEWDVSDALRTAGFDPAELEPVNELRESTAAILRSVADEELIREVAARLARARLETEGQREFVGQSTEPLAGPAEYPPGYPKYQPPSVADDPEDRRASGG